MMKLDTSVPRVELPDLSEAERAQIEAVHEEMDWYQRTRMGMLRALLLKGVKPFTGVRKPVRKPTRHQRHMANVKARAAYLKAVSE